MFTVYAFGVFNSNVRLKKSKGPTELFVIERSPLNYGGKVLTVHVWFSLKPTCNQQGGEGSFW